MTRKTTLFNRGLADARPSATRTLIDKVSDARARGAPIIALCAEEPEAETPAHIRAAAIRAIADGNTRHTPVAGLRGLREAVAAKFARDNGLEVDWTHTLVCSGASHVVFNALAATLHQGDEVVIPAPCWERYPQIVRLCGATPVMIACAEAEGFKVTPGQLAAALTRKTRWVILNAPSNPTGAVYTREELTALAAVLLAHPEVLVLSDDRYEHLTFDGLAFHTLAQVEPRLRSRTLTVNGVSQAYAMAGWRIGFATGPRGVLEAMTGLQAQQTAGACSISQFAAMAALDGPTDCLVETRRVLQQRRDKVVAWLNRAPGLSCRVPGGAFYVFASCKGLIGGSSPAGRRLASDEDVAEALLAEAGVAVVHGSAFGLAGYLRISYAVEDAELARGCEAIIRFCASSRTGGEA